MFQKIFLLLTTFLFFSINGSSNQIVKSKLNNLPVNLAIKIHKFKSQLEISKLPQSIVNIVKEYLNDFTQCYIPDNPFIHSHLYRSAFSPNGKYLVLTGDNGLMLYDIEKKVYKLLNPKLINQFSFLVNGDILQDPLASALSISPNSQQVATVNTQCNSIIKIYNPKKELQNNLIGHTDKVVKLTFTNNSDKLISGSIDGSIRLWNLSNNSCLVKQEFQKLTDSLKNALDLCPNGYFAIVSKNGINYFINIGNILQQNTTQKINAGFDPISTISFSDNCKIIAAGSYRFIKLFNAQTGLLVKLLETQHNTSPSSISFSPQSQYLVATWNDDCWNSGQWDEDSWNDDCNNHTNIKVWKNNSLLLSNVQEYNNFSDIQKQDACNCTKIKHS